MSTSPHLADTKKRKKPSAMASEPTSKRRAVAVRDDGKTAAGKRGSARASTSERIEVLESQIAQSRKHYNNIVELIALLGLSDGAGNDTAETFNISAALSLCRVFCRLLAGGQLSKTKGASEQDLIVVAWLRERYQEFQDALLVVLLDGKPSHQDIVLSLCFQLMKEQSTHLSGPEVWSSGFFPRVVSTVVEARADGVRTTFVEQYIRKHHDIAVYMVLALTKYLSHRPHSTAVDHSISLLSELGVPPPADTEFDDFFTDRSQIGSKSRGAFTSVTSFKRKVQEAWLALLRSPLSEAQRKSLLRVMSRSIAPWFVKPEMLMDFLTDSYNQGGSISLLALSGLFYLIQERNLDYPHFYTKLYSLLDADLLHSKHRSRFFRLLITFLDSSHLPAALVASFIKRLARLALNAPPTAIVCIVPYLYNLFKAHPYTTFMMHRELRDPETKRAVESQGMRDPFSMAEQDPMLTGAIDSCIWEIETLQSHYHPNVASIARIISEQFTKPSYNVEDFLDYSYQGLLEAELGAGLEEEKTFRKPPVVEYQIPKRIFTDRMLEQDGGADTESCSLMRQLWDYS
ncbi:hypothetical protein KEM52_005711 [Ascosphaera acerosa]|nr:hypothetical protein KEM52_005711 [Ascosphaera acerosa]